MPKKLLATLAVLFVAACGLAQYPTAASPFADGFSGRTVPLPPTWTARRATNFTVKTTKIITFIHVDFSGDNTHTEDLPYWVQISINGVPTQVTFVASHPGNDVSQYSASAQVYLIIPSGTDFIIGSPSKRPIRAVYISGFQYTQ